MRSVILPPSLIASRALTTRLTITCSNWLRSALTSQRSRPCTTSSSIVSPTSRRSSICSSESTSRQLQRLRPQRLAAREREQLPHQARRAIGVLLDLHDVLEGRIGRPVVGEQQIGIADDRGQHVVEVVRDAAGELADRLHLLALREILLQRALFGGVEREHDRARAFAALRIGGRDEEARRSRSPRPRSPRRPARCRPCLRCAAAIAARSAGVVALGDAAIDRGPRFAGAGLQRGGRELGEGAVGAQHEAARVDRRDRHRRRIEDARESHLRRRAGPRRVRRRAPTRAPACAKGRAGPRWRTRPGAAGAPAASGPGAASGRRRTARSSPRRDVPDTTESSDAPSPAMMSPSLSCPAANCARS